jgi:acyl carrier protein
MDTQEIKTVLLDAFQRTKGKQLDVSKISDTSNLATDLGLDSLDMIETVWEIEKRFDVSINEQELKSLSTVNEVVKFIDGLLKAKSNN